MDGSDAHDMVPQSNERPVLRDFSGVYRAVGLSVIFDVAMAANEMTKMADSLGVARSIVPPEFSGFEMMAIQSPLAVALGCGVVALWPHLEKPSGKLRDVVPWLIGIAGVFTLPTAVAPLQDVIKNDFRQQHQQITVPQDAPNEAPAEVSPEDVPFTAFYSAVGTPSCKLS